MGLAGDGEAASLWPHGQSGERWLWTQEAGANIPLTTPRL